MLFGVAFGGSFGESNLPIIGLSIVWTFCLNFGRTATKGFYEPSRLLLRNFRISFTASFLAVRVIYKTSKRM